MVEISEKERKKRKYQVRDGDYNIAMSFRLEPEYRDRLDALAEAYSASKTDVLRKMIDTAYNHTLGRHK